MASRAKSIVGTAPDVRRVLMRLWPYTRQQKAAVASSMVALLASIALRLLEPWPLTIIVDHVIQLGDNGKRVPLPAVLRELDPLNLTVLCCVILVVVTSLRALARFINRVGFARIGNRVIAALRRDVFSHIQRLPLSFHTSARTGDLVLRVVQDVGMMRDAAVTAVLPLMASVLIMVTLWSVMFWLQWQLALLALATTPLLALRTANLTGRIRDAGRKQRKRQGALAATAAQAIGAIKDVQALSMEDTFEDAFGTHSKRSEKEDVQAARLTASLGRAVDVLIAVATALVLGAGTLLVLRAQMSAGELLVFLTYLRRAFTPVKDFAKHTGRLAKATAAGERVLDLLEEESDVRDSRDAIDAPPFRGAVRFESVSFGYEEKRPVLRELDFEASPGQQIALVGPSGIGKTTLTDLLLRFYDPQKGRILIDGLDLRKLKLASLRAQFSVVLQNPLLFAASIRENIGYGALECTDEDLREAARQANASEFIERLPKGYDTQLGERGAKLSGGERQRIAIARSLVRRAPILILDEPTAGLDEVNRQTVIEALGRLSVGCTTFIVSHDRHLSSAADIVLYMEDGHVVEQGSPADLMALGGRYAALARA